MFARTDRLPAWSAPHQRADVYPVEVLRDPPAIKGLRQRVESDVAARRRYSVFDISIEGIRYQVVALLTYEGTTRERLDRVFGVAVNLDWARNHYFNDILQQVAQIAGSASATPFAVIDEQGRRIAGTLNPTRGKPWPQSLSVVFFDPTLIAVDPPADLDAAVVDDRRERRWRPDVRAGRARRTAESGRGGAGVALLALSLFATRAPPARAPPSRWSAPISSPRSPTS